jgi:Flp pilus assembly protein TadG
MSPQSLSLRNAVDRSKPGEHGQTLVLFLLMMVLLFVFVGMGIDLGFAYITKARLSKGVDSAALTGMRNLYQGQAQASLVASNAFAANYGKSGRDVAPPTLTVNFGTVNGNTVLNVSATVAVNTFFIRVLPSIGLGNWNTLSVGSSAQATRANLIMSVVLDVSGSMAPEPQGDGGIPGLQVAVPDFVNQFDNNNDQVAMVTFSCGATTPVPMTTHFQSPIDTAVKGLSAVAWTCSEVGLTNGLAQNQSTPITPGQNVVKVIVFFTDGLANTWYWPGFNCGGRDIAPDTTLYDTNALDSSDSSHCTVPGTIAGLSGTVNTSDQCGDMYAEADARAEAIAYLARAESNTVYCIGFGSPTGTPECGHPPLNIAFLKDLANTADSATYNSAQPSGDVAIGSDASDIDQLFQTIAADILLRLSQ